MNQEDCSNLIKLVRSNPCIWDRSHSMHNNYEHVKTVWIAIAEQLNYTVQKTRAKWKNLRDSYRSQLYREINASAENNNSTTFETYWPFYDEMSFLRDHMYRKPSSKDRYILENDPVNLENLSNKLNGKEGIRHIEMLTVDNFDSSVLAYLNQNDSPNVSSKKKSIVVSANSTSDESTEDEDRCFFDSLLPYMKLLSPKDKMLCRMRIQEVIFSVAFPEARNEKGSDSCSNFNA